MSYMSIFASFNKIIQIMKYLRYNSKNDTVRLELNIVDVNVFVLSNSKDSLVLPF